MNVARAVVTALALLSMLATGSVLAFEPAGNLIIVGNGPEQTVMEALARAFEKAHPRAYIDVLWDTQLNPPEMVKRGQAHIAVSASTHPDLASTQIGWDGIGILVHLSNFTKELTKQQVALIFAGAVKEWSEVGGPETRISLIDRPRSQNIRDAFESQLEIVGKISDTAKTIDSDDLVVKTVAGTLPPLSAVAYISLSSGLSAVSSGVAVRLMPIDKVEPEAPTVRDGRYSLRRPLLLLSGPQPDPLVQAFITFARSAPGQAIVGNEYISLQSE